MYIRSLKPTAAGILCLYIALSSAVNFVLKELPKTNSLPSKDSDSKGRITNGQNIDITAAPYYVQIANRNRKLFCGGTMVSNITVVTAAHCVDNIDMQQIKVAANAKKINDGGQVRKVVEVHIHPDYDPNTYHADVAVLRVNTPFKKSKGLSPILMCSKPLKDDDEIEIVGWGKTVEDGMDMAARLQSITVKGMTHEDCAARMNITETMICSKVAKGMDACQGDSGGPVISVKDYCLAGVVSWGRGCGRDGIPGVITDILNVRPFIRKSRSYERSNVVKV